MYEQLLKTVTNLGSPRVLVVGDFMLDIYIYGDALRISPEAPVPVLKVTKKESSCGGAASVANDLAALGAVPVCLGVIGDDENGRILKQKLQDVGADVSGLVSTKDRPTISKHRLVGLAQHRHKQQLLRYDEENTENLSDELGKKLIEAYKTNLKNVKAVCIQDYNKGLFSSQICQEMIRLAKDAKIKVLVDPSPIKDYSKYAGATLITPNRTETSLAIGFEIKTIEAAKRAAEQLKKNLNLEAAIITLDKEGAYLKTDSIDEQIPTRPRVVYDVTGAGDMVLAALAITLAAGCDYKTAVQISNIAGGIEVEKFGVATVSVDEIINDLVAHLKPSDSKIAELPVLTEELDWLRKQNQKIVFTNGCFDVIHRGHIEYLKFCKTHGDILVVGLNSDSSVRELKGPTRPINNQHDRAAVLAAMEFVDYIVVFGEPTPLELIMKVKPDILIKGQDWAEKGVVGREFVESRGGKVVLAPLVEGKSSTATIEKMKSLGEK